MKKMILAATAVGAALAGSILYLRKKGAPVKEIAAGEADPVARLQNRSKHSMG
ncbi:MAG: hypothetical protein JWP88_659 [Flaviaesturariibacter sp.]|nr:hypothetical protein [Flaviaesturariibacter sp.]